MNLHLKRFETVWEIYLTLFGTIVCCLKPVQIMSKPVLKTKTYDTFHLSHLILQLLVLPGPVIRRPVRQILEGQGEVGEYQKATWTTIVRAWAIHPDSDQRGEGFAEQKGDGQAGRARQIHQTFDKMVCMIQDFGSTDLCVPLPLQTPNWNYV